MGQMRVFVSHTSQDKTFADALVKALRQAGAGVWYDEHNLGAGPLLDEMTTQLKACPIFVVLLSKAAFASEWVRRECKWAFNFYSREPTRTILPVVAAPIDATDFDSLVFMEDFKRIEAPGYQPYPPAEAIAQTLRQLALTLPGQQPVGQAVSLGKHEVILVANGTSDVESLVASGKADIRGLIARGKALVAQYKYDEALVFFRVATALQPGSYDAWFALGDSLDHLPDYLAEEAIEA